MNDLLELTVGEIAAPLEVEAWPGKREGNEGREREGKEGKEGEGERGFGSLCPCCHRIAIPSCQGSAPDQMQFVTRYRFDSQQAPGGAADRRHWKQTQAPAKGLSTPQSEGTGSRRRTRVQRQAARIRLSRSIVAAGGGTWGARSVGGGQVCCSK